MRFNCPFCRKECDFMEIQMESDIHAIIKMMPLFGRHAHLVSGYCMLFGISPLKIKARKFRLLLEEMKTLFEQERFSYQKKTHRISAAGIVRALDVVVKKNFSEHLENHNYLKKVMIGIAEEEAREAGQAAERDLRAREVRLREGRREEGRTEEGDRVNRQKVRDLIKGIGG
jgi:hypothetical protein